MVREESKKAPKLKKKKDERMFSRIIRRVVQVIAFAIPILAALVVIFQFFLPDRLPPIRKELDIVITEGLPDAISEGLYLIPIRCKRPKTGAETVVKGFKVDISTSEGSIEKVTYTGITPNNQKEIDDVLESGGVSSTPSIEYPSIDEGAEFAIIVLIRADRGIPRLTLIGFADEKKAKMIRWQEVLDEIIRRRG